MPNPALREVSLGDPASLGDLRVTVPVEVQAPASPSVEQGVPVVRSVQLTGLQAPGRESPQVPLGTPAGPSSAGLTSIWDIPQTATGQGDGTMPTALASALGLAPQRPPPGFALNDQAQPPEVTPMARYPWLYTGQAGSSIPGPSMPVSLTESRLDDLIAWAQHQKTLLATRDPEVIPDGSEIRQYTADNFSSLVMPTGPGNTPRNFLAIGELTFTGVLYPEDRMPPSIRKRFTAVLAASEPRSGDAVASAMEGHADFKSS